MQKKQESSLPLWMTQSPKPTPKAIISRHPYPRTVTQSPKPTSKAIISSHSSPHRFSQSSKPAPNKYPESYQAAIHFNDYPYNQSELFFMLFGFSLYVQKKKVKDNFSAIRYYWRATQKIGNVWHHVHICPGVPFHLPNGLFETARYKIARYLLQNHIWVPMLEEDEQPKQEDVHGQVEFILVKQIDHMADISTTVSEKEPIPIQTSYKPIFSFIICPPFPSLFRCD